jgi:hypothetical protein
MFIAYAVLVVLLSLALLGSAVGKLTKQQKVVDSLTGVGVPASWFPLLAAAEIAGAAGLVLGLWVPALGIAAGAGVVLYFVGAVVAHLRVENHEVVPPATLALLALAATLFRALSL